MLPDGPQLAAHARVVNGDDRLRALRDERFDPGLIEVQGVGPHIGKDGPRAAQDEGIHRGDKGEGRHDDFIAGPDIQEQGGHFEGVRARRGQQNPGGAEGLLEEGLALLREGPVAGDVAIGDGLGDVDLFPSLETRPVEGDAQPGRRRLDGMGRFSDHSPPAAPQKTAPPEG